MKSKRFWATTATIFAPSVFGPRSFGVWAQEQAVCRAKPPTSTTSPGGPGDTPGFDVRAAGWEWVRFFLVRSSPTRKTTYNSAGAHLFLCRSRTRLGKIHVLSFPCWTPRVVVPVSVQSAIPVTGPFDSVYFSNLPDLAIERYTGLRFSPTRWYLRGGS